MGHSRKFTELILFTRPMQVQDSDPNSLSAGGWLEDVSLVKKYEISEEDYDKREG